MPRKSRPGNRLKDKHARFQHICPHCGSVAVTRTTREMSPLTRELYIQCCNFECGHTWRALLAAVATIVPSRTPNPAIFIARSTRKLNEEMVPTDERQIGLDGVPALPPQEQD